MRGPAQLLISALACVALSTCVPLSAGMAVIGCAALLGCAAGARGDDASRAEAVAASVPSPPEWVASPAADWDAQAEPLLVQVTGSAVIEEGIASAEKVAQADALALLGAFLDGALAQLDAPGAPPSGVVAALQSARVRGKFHDGRRFYVWMACDAGAALSGDATPATRDALARLVTARNRG